MCKEDTIQKKERGFRRALQTTLRHSGERGVVLVILLGIDFAISNASNSHQQNWSTNFPKFHHHVDWFHSSIKFSSNATCSTCICSVTREALPTDQRLSEFQVGDVLFVFLFVNGGKNEWSDRSCGFDRGQTLKRLLMHEKAKRLQISDPYTSHQSQTRGAFAFESPLHLSSD